MTLALPNHLPEITGGIFQRTLSRNEGISQTVPLKVIKSNIEWLNAALSYINKGGINIVWSVIVT